MVGREIQRMKNFIVYKHTGPSGKVYIDITGRKPEKRRGNGKWYKRCTHMMAAIEKYGWNNIRHDIIAQGLTKEEAEEAEIKYIALYKSNDRRYGYNIDFGGSASGRMSAQTREKNRLAHERRQQPDSAIRSPFQRKEAQPRSKGEDVESRQRSYWEICFR